MEHQELVGADTCRPWMLWKCAVCLDMVDPVKLWELVDAGISRSEMLEKAPPARTPVDPDEGRLDKHAAQKDLGDICEDVWTDILPS